ncbi:hypothetical protein LRP30_32585 [Bradyrhizobium sp. C-145]|uniref:hypothetical protein n=1 Tax=Bradyrhizobium sp. C-145 TaxID=574727 RepID=UPI00201B49B4|nr:hypothetical protein [Bradyrhizobium sp. C-145]UQR61540.1 hypothetical protein LRP30_32585 [Bradyrhizobium sp. C-145]
MVPTFYETAGPEEERRLLEQTAAELVSLTLSLAHSVAMMLMKVPPQEWLNGEFAQTPAVQALRERVRFTESKTKWFYPDVFDDARLHACPKCWRQCHHGQGHVPRGD